MIDAAQRNQRTREADSQRAAEAALTEQQARENWRLAPHDVTYVVTGTVQAARLTYSNGIGGTQQETVTLPWKGSVSTRQGGSLYISAQNAGRFGEIMVGIIIDGVAFTGSNSSGAYAVATAGGACCP